MNLHFPSSVNHIQEDWDSHHWLQELMVPWPIIYSGSIMKILGEWMAIVFGWIKKLACELQENKGIIAQPKDNSQLINNSVISAKVKYSGRQEPIEKYPSVYSGQGIYVHWVQIAMLAI